MWHGTRHGACLVMSHIRMHHVTDIWTGSRDTCEGFVSHMNRVMPPKKKAVMSQGHVTLMKPRSHATRTKETCHTAHVFTGGTHTTRECITLQLVVIQKAKKTAHINRLSLFLSSSYVWRDSLSTYVTWCIHMYDVTKHRVCNLYSLRIAHVNRLCPPILETLWGVCIIHMYIQVYLYTCTYIYITLPYIVHKLFVVFVLKTLHLRHIFNKHAWLKVKFCRVSENVGIMGQFFPGKWPLGHEICVVENGMIVDFHLTIHFFDTLYVNIPQVYCMSLNALEHVKNTRIHSPGRRCNFFCFNFFFLI